MAELAFNAGFKLAAKTADAVDAAMLKRAEDGLRPHLGASLIGRKCNRALWYSFRWATLVTHPARLLRVFGRGHREESVLTQYLRDAGLKVMTVDLSTGRQFSFSDGHFGGSMDGAALGVLEAPKTWHAIEYKTSSKKMFDILSAKGVKEAKPEHWAQMQIYMLKFELTRALYVAVNKDDDSLHMERIEFDKDAAQAFVDKAQWIISLNTPPDGISTDQTYFECKWCDHSALCHGTAAPLPTCRSCTHSTALREGTWQCALRGKQLSVDDQKRACDGHRVIPILLKNWATPIDACDADNWVKYQLKTGGEFVNGEAPDGITGAELHALEHKSALVDPVLLKYRKEFDGRVVA